MGGKGEKGKRGKREIGAEEEMNNGGIKGTNGQGDGGG